MDLICFEVTWLQKHLVCDKIEMRSHCSERCTTPILPYRTIWLTSNLSPFGQSLEHVLAQINSLNRNLEGIIEVSCATLPVFWSAYLI